MNDDGILGGALNQLGQTVKAGAKQIVKMPEEMAKDVSGQIGGEKQTQETLENKPQHQWQSDEERVKFLRDLYGSSEKNSSREEKLADKSPEEQKKLLELRSQLHKQNYYDPTFNPVKRQEERPAEKVENEKKQEMQELQKKEEEKTPPLAVVRERNKAEMFRGASG